MCTKIKAIDTDDNFLVLGDESKVEYMRQSIIRLM